MENKPCQNCKNRGWETMDSVAACNCCEAPDYEFYLPDKNIDEIRTAYDENGIAYFLAAEGIHAQHIVEVLQKESKNCIGCTWIDKRHQKCTCCKRNLYLKDNYLPANQDG